MFKVGMRDEIIPVRFRPAGIHGALHFSRTGCISFIITALDSEIFPPVGPVDYQSVPWAETEDAIARDSRSEKRY
jgi:hypothetical protein